MKLPELEIHFTTIQELASNSLPEQICDWINKYNVLKGWKVTFDTSKNCFIKQKENKKELFHVKISWRR